MKVMTVRKNLERITLMENMKEKTITILNEFSLAPHLNYTNYNYPSQAASLYKPKLELDQAALSMNMWAAATASHAIQAEYTGQQPPIPNPYSFLPSTTPTQQAAVSNFPSYPSHNHQEGHQPRS